MSTDPTPAAARGSDATYCEKWPDDGHDYAFHKPTHATVSVGICNGCGFIDGVDLQRQVDAARAERTGPAAVTGCGRRSATGDCPDHPLREPTAGEDAEVVKRTLLADRFLSLHVFPTGHEAELGDAILAALDLPGRAPTQWAYDQACKALETHRARADAAEAELTKARAQIEQLRVDRAWEQNRANEAARLSADAHDRADDLAKELAEAREHTDIVEQGRSDLIVLIHRAQEAMPDTVDEEAELDQQVRALVATIAETREVTADDIARHLERDADDEAQRPNRTYVSEVIERWLRQAAEIARQHGKGDPS